MRKKKPDVVMPTQILAQEDESTDDVDCAVGFTISFNPMPVRSKRKPKRAAVADSLPVAVGIRKRKAR